MLFDHLEQIGFTKSEAKIYIELLKVGPQPVSVVAKRVAYNRTTTYGILNTLEDKGVVSSFKNGAVRFFVPNDPNCLIGVIDRKCKTFDYYRAQLLNLMPKFRALTQSYNFKKPVVTYFDGIEGVKHVMYDALRFKGDFYSYISFHKWFDSGLTNFLLEYKNIRIFDKKLKLRALVPDTSEVRAFFSDNYDPKDKMTEFLFVPGGENNGMFENEMNIYGGKVAIIHLDRGDEYAVIIESKEVSSMQKSIFEMVWKSMPG